jgi:hypothetical protein
MEFYQNAPYKKGGSIPFGMQVRQGDASSAAALQQPGSSPLAGVPSCRPAKPAADRLASPRHAWHIPHTTAHLASPPHLAPPPPPPPPQRGNYLTSEERMRRKWNEWAKSGGNGSAAGSHGAPSYGELVSSFETVCDAAPEELDVKELVRRAGWLAGWLLVLVLGGDCSRGCRQARRRCPLPCCCTAPAASRPSHPPPYHHHRRRRRRRRRHH